MSRGTGVSRRVDVADLGGGEPSPTTRVPLAILLTLVVAASAAELVAVLVATRGHFTYSLDDPYIHLSLAREISHGHYGINADASSSPSSSVLWPFLLAPFARLSFAGWVPLALDLACTCGSAAVLYASFRRLVTATSAAIAAGIAVVSLNLVGVAFTGMEHSLQVLLVLVISLGVVRAHDDGQVSWWLPAALVLAPLVRYEDAAVSLAAAGVLVALGHRRVGIGSVAAWGSLLAAFSGFLVLLGLSPLPSSVLAKTHYQPGTPLAWEVATRLVFALRHATFLMCLVVLLADALARRRWSLLHTYVVVILGAHAVLGDFGWFGRYQLYVFAACLLPLARLVAQWRLPLVVLLRVAVGLATVATCWPLVSITLRTPAAARDVWSQQGQTARFVADYWQAPVAVNDIGQVSWRGGQPVLDLWGLADQQVRVSRQEGKPGWLADSVDRSGAGLVAVYPEWFAGDIPSTWRRVGTLVGSRIVTSSQRNVAFYAVDRAASSRACRDLAAFARTVPSVTRVVLSCQ